jgi:hypothetical protein
MLGSRRGEVLKNPAGVPWRRVLNAFGERGHEVRLVVMLALAVAAVMELLGPGVWGGAAVIQFHSPNESRSTIC